ncbi:MAG: hypothetical protein ACRERE_33330 [Candidatus Entotheonellia bacterium]
MRELTKSMFSFSWAMSLFGLQQIVNLSAPSGAAKAFDNVTAATEEVLGDLLKATFRAGDSLQRGVVDLTLAVLTLQAFNPSRGAGLASEVIQQSANTVQQTMRSASDVGRRSTEAVRQGVWEITPAPQRASSSPSQQPSQGWGPMPAQGPAHPQGAEG